VRDTPRRSRCWATASSGFVGLRRAFLRDEGVQHALELERFDVRGRLGLGLLVGVEPGQVRAGVDDGRDVGRAQSTCREPRCHPRQALQDSRAVDDRRPCRRIAARGHGDEHPGGAGAQDPGVCRLVRLARHGGQIGLDPVAQSGQ